MLKVDILLKIRQNKTLKNECCVAWNISPSTLQRWLQTNDPMLTRWDRLEFLCKSLGMDEPSDLVEKSVSHFNN